jgi:hypothetical protein
MTDSLQAAYFSVTPSLISNLKIELIAGQKPPPSEMDSHLVLVNEEATGALQFKNPADAIRKLMGQITFQII